jgi:triosephosphate isomerase
MEITNAKDGRTIFIGGNWKCNGDNKFINDHCKFLNEITWDQEKCEVCVCPSLIHLEKVRGLLDERYIVGSQNVSMYENGAYTGEVSAKLLKDINIHWALIGHSERRQYFETDDVVVKKLKIAIDNGLNVIYCIGEKLAEREDGKTMEVVYKQLKDVVESISDWSKVVIAYEPVWAIGTGKTASPQQAQEVHAEIRQWLVRNVSEDVAKKTRILYGGSVTETNCNDLIIEKDIDGFLVGGASLKQGFKAIIQSHTKVI